MFSEVFCLLTSGLMSQTSRNLDSESETILWKPISDVAPPDGFIFYEGDILLPAGDNGKNAIGLKQYLWENGRIPYEFNDSFATSEEILIREAMAHLENETCIRFVEKNDCDDTFISFQKKNSGCFAPIGRLPTNNGALPVNFQTPGCFKQKSIIEHELLHVVGLFHEQSRPDRDDYVTIHWCNILPSREKEFVKVSDVLVDNYGLPYDYSSIMHYSRLAFSRNGLPTITAKLNPNMALGQSMEPTENDLKKVIKMYSCQETVQTEQQQIS